MALGLQFSLLGLRAAGVFGVQLAVGFQRPPPGGLVLPALVTGPGGDGDENSCRDGLGKVRAALFATNATSRVQDKRFSSLMQCDSLIFYFTHWEKGVSSGCT